MQSYRHCPPLRTEKKTVKKTEIWVKFFIIGCVFYRVGDWDNLLIDLHVSLHDGFKIQFAGIVPVFLEFSGSTSYPGSFTRHSPTRGRKTLATAGHVSLRVWEIK